MNDAERKRWKRNAGKAEAFLVGCLDNPDISFVQRVKAAELILYQYYGRPAVGTQDAARPHDIRVDFGSHEDYAL